MYRSTLFDLKISFISLGDGDLPSSDVLTCGECNKKFALQQLVTYIQHKATNCNKQMQQGNTKDENMQMDDVIGDNNGVEEVHSLVAKEKPFSIEFRSVLGHQA